MVMFSARVFRFWRRQQGEKKGNNDEIGYGGGNGLFSSIYALLASKSSMKLIGGE
jgi:hypothetical protein